MKACRTPRVTKPLLSLTMIDRGLQTNSLLIMSSENITHLTTLKTVVSASLSDGFRATRTSTPPSALSDGNDIRGRHWPSPGYPANGLCDIQTVTTDTKRKARSCFPLKRQLIQPRTTKLMSFVRCNIFWIPVTHRPAPARLVFWDGTQDKRAIIRMIW